MGGGRCFRCFRKTARSTRQERQASTLESVIRGRHIYKHADLAAACRRDTNLGTGEGYNHDKFAVSLLKDATVLGHVPQSFCECFDTSSGAERPSLVKFPIEESVVKPLSSASSRSS